MMTKAIEKAIAVVAVGVFSILPIISTAVLTSPPGPGHKCMTDECKVERLESAAQIIEYSDDNADPCENLYQFVCGNYDKNDFTNDDSFIEYMKMKEIDRMIGHISEFKGEGSDSNIIKLVDDLHKTCMNTDAIGSQAVDLLKKHVEEMGGWPALVGADWKEDDFNWIDFTGNAKKAGYNIIPFIDWVPEKSYTTEGSTLTYGLQPNKNYFHEDVNSESEKEIYGEYIGMMARTLEVHAQKDFDDVYDFEKKLSDIDHKNDDKEEMTVEDLKTKWPSVDWQKFVDNAIMPFADAGEKPVLTVWNVAALTNFLDLMEKTPKRVQANHAIWKMVQLAIPYLDEPIQDARKKFYDAIGKPIIPRESLCDETVKYYAEHAVRHMYMHQYESSEETIENMFASLKNEMIKILKESTKLSENDKKEAVETLEKMDYTIGPSEKLSHPKGLENFYADAKIIMDNFMQTILNLNIFKMTKDYSNKLHTEMFQYESIGRTSKAMPDNYRDHIYISTQMFPSKFFDNNRPMYMNYGAAGASIGREMYSSFYHIGRNLTIEAKDVSPNEQVECFRHMVDGMDDPVLKEAFVEGTLFDIIGQFIGFRIARAAYDNYIAQSGPEKELPGLSYTPGQLFWMSFLQSFCFAKIDNVPIIMVKGKQYTVTEFMTMAMFMNVPQVSEDFKCPAGSTMNPANKCTWW